MEDRDINLAGLRLVKEFEGCKLSAYRDSAGVLTIGYGHTSKAGPPTVTPGLSITQADAEAILRQDLQLFEDAVQKLVTVDLTDNEFAALTSLCFNIGATAFAGSTCLKRLNKGDRKGAAEALTWWNKAGGKRLGGLVRRRAAEKALFLAPIDRPGLAVLEAVKKAQEPQETRKSWLGSRTIAGTATAATGALAAVSEAVDAASDAADSAKGLVGQVTGFVGAHPLLTGAAALIVTGLGVVVYARRNDWIKGLR